MEPNKFEEHIRTQLEEREIRPSKEAWSKLEAQLGEAKGGSKTLWYAIAASLVALVVVGSFLLNRTSAVSNEIVQETPNVTNDGSIIEVASSEENTTKEQLETNTPEKSVVSKRDAPEPQIATTKESVKSNSQVKKLLPETEAIKKEAIAKNEPPKSLLKEIEKKDIVTLKVDEVVTEVKRLTQENNTVTPQEIEALLAKAQKDISNQRILKEATTSIDPANLLQDVESELERSFRDKVFDALGEGFNTVRTAVLERNN
jgi:hypothetical protein